MAEIDLIPNDYRTWLEQRAVLRKYAVGFAALNFVLFLAGSAMGKIGESIEAKASHLRTENAITKQQQLQLEQLKQQQSELERQWSLLRGLRAGAAVEDIFQIVDKTLVAGELWFLDWSFRRAGVTVDQPQDAGGTYLTVVSDADPKLRVETHMSIRGQAKDHQALSTFVRGLFEQPLIKDVNVQKTSLSGFATGRVVDFEMTVILSSASQAT